MQRAHNSQAHSKHADEETEVEKGKALHPRAQVAEKLNLGLFNQGHILAPPLRMPRSKRGALGTPSMKLAYHRQLWRVGGRDSGWGAAPGPGSSALNLESLMKYVITEKADQPACMWVTG